MREWLEEGGEREDDWFRYLQHFHDPLKPWDSAGLDVRIRRFTSSVRWMQERDQGSVFAGNWSWQDARRLYYEALTEADPRRREALWADLFRTLGQIMHLVVDASVPEHARNDAHLLGAVKVQNSYERWVGNQHAGGTPRELAFVAKYLAAPIGFTEQILSLPPPPGELVAAVPVARLIDADRYDGSNPQVTVGGDPRAPAAIGLAEIANANFFSEDTLRGEYPHPGDHGLVAATLPTPSGRVRRYFSRPAGQGLLPAHPLRAECAAEAYYWRGEYTQPPPYPCVDAAVWAETASHMLPRAVGYARAVLDYFFRASMRVHGPYMEAGSAFMRIENLTNEEMEGVFEMYARPGAGTEDEGRSQTGVINNGTSVTIAAHAMVTVPVTLLPPSHPTAAQILVFRGRIGLQQDAVAGQVFTVPHVVAAQTGATAVLRETCLTSEFPENRHTRGCAWSPTRHIAEGELIADPAVPVIARVSARALFGRPDLELDGLPVAGGIWQRLDREPNPRRFRVILPVSNPHGLTLTVSLVDGSTVSTPLAAFNIASASADKFYTIPIFGSKPPWYVAAGRLAHTRVTAAPAYRAVSVSGYPNPTAVVTDTFSIPALREQITVGSFAGGSETAYFQRWIDYAHMYTSAPPGGPVLLQPVLKAEFEGLSLGPPPRVPWEALMERIYQPAELELLKVFVAAAPPPQTFTVVGRLGQPGT